MQVSANLGFLYTDLPLPARIRAAASDGFDAVECHFPYAHDPAEIRSALEATGLSMLALNTRPGDQGAGEFGLAALPGRSDDARAAVAQAVSYGAAIGAGAVHVMAGRSGAAAGAEAAFRDTLAHACDLAAPHGMTILIEPINTRDVPGYHLTSLEQAAGTIAALGRDNLKIMFDCYHLQILQGDLTRRFAEHLPLIGHVQIAAVPDRGEPDAGELCYAGLLRGFREAGYRGAVGAEYRPRGGATRAGLGWLPPLRAALDAP
ncbi:hydroxypyruvate isomerase family protein [Salipiger bermudensis]|uniref:hydroxypyruvate isomerase family protein n=1 Tax=Salipiger bermudensis TaxID=344736 RepID=UPI001CD3D978|nr:TIM barrel protein [Salipiger bermudensis]MCA0960726.1 TIM barrel protein [Salipiger bermudensis]